MHFAACHIFCFSKTKEVVEVPAKQKLSLKTQLAAAAKNKPYMIAVAGQLLFGLTLYGRNAMHCIIYICRRKCGSVQHLLSVYHHSVDYRGGLLPGCVPLTGNKGRAASIFALLTGISMFAMYFFTATDTPVTFYLFSALAQFFFSGFNTAIYAVIPDCVEYGSGRQVSGMTVSSMRLSHWGIKWVWRSEHLFLRLYLKCAVMWRISSRTLRYSV